MFSHTDELDIHLRSNYLVVNHAGINPTSINGYGLFSLTVLYTTPISTFIVLNFPSRSSAVSRLTHLIIRLSEFSPHLESGAGALGTPVTVAI